MWDHLSVGVEAHVGPLFRFKVDYLWFQNSSTHCFWGLKYSPAFSAMAGGLDLEAHHPPINTCFGWVLFDKIQGSDVVDVANLTLEQDALKSWQDRDVHMWLYLPPIRKGTSDTYDEGTDEWLRYNHIFHDVNLITKNVKFGSKGLTDPGSRKVQGIQNLQASSCE